MVLHWHGKEGLGAITRHLVKLARAGKVETFFRIGIGNIDAFCMDRRVGGDHRIVRLTILAIKRQIGKLHRDRLASGAAVGNIQRVGAYNFETQGLPVFAHPIQRPAIGVSNRFRGEQYVFEQPIDITLAG